MPIALDPNQTVSVRLHADDGIAFKCRHLTVRQTIQLRQLLEKSRTASGDDEALPIMLEALSLGVVGVEGDADTGPFKIDRLLDLLTPLELWQLALEMQRQTRATEADLKNLRSRQPSDGAHSAAVAAPGNV